MDLKKKNGSEAIALLPEQAKKIPFQEMKSIH